MLTHTMRVYLYYQYFYPQIEHPSENLSPCNPPNTYKFCPECPVISRLFTHGY